VKGIARRLIPVAAAVLLAASLVHAQAPRLVTGVVIAVNANQITLYRAQFDSPTPGGTERVTLTLDASTRIFRNAVRVSWNGLRLDETAVIQFVERGSLRIATEINAASDPRRGNNRPPPPAETSRQPEKPSIPAPLRRQVVTGDIERATENRLVLTLDRDMNTSLRAGTRFDFMLTASTLVIYNERRVDPLEIQAGGKATVTYVELDGRHVANEIRLLAGSASYAPLGTNESSPARPRDGSFEFYGLRIQATEEDTRPISVVRNGTECLIALRVVIRNATTDRVDYEVAMGRLGIAPSLSEKFTATIPRGFTGTHIKTFKVHNQVPGGEAVYEVIGTVRMNGVAQNRTVRYRVSGGAGSVPGKE
jgi:hypothetical protein